MLSDFLLKKQDAILALTKSKTQELAGEHPSSDQLRQGLPVFYRQVIEVIRHAGSPEAPPPKDVGEIAKAADRGDEPGMAVAAGQPLEAVLARTAGSHGLEMLRLGYTLSHVVHAYGAMCQAITEVATEEKVPIAVNEFHALNRSLDVAIAGAVTVYQSRKDAKGSSPDGPGGRGLVDELRLSLTRAQTAFQAIQRGSVGPGGSTGGLLESSLLRMEQLLDQASVAGDLARTGGGSPGSP